MIQQNRIEYLEALRSGNYQKGCIKSDEKGNPIIQSEEDNNGHCCCAVMVELFGKTDTGKYSLPKAMKALGITTKDCQYIQKDINDNDSSLIDNADKIEKEVFKIFNS